LNGSIKPPGGENGRDGEASTFLAEGEAESSLFYTLLDVLMAGSKLPADTRNLIKKVRKDSQE
jgi:hypothetical protein